MKKNISSMILLSFLCYLNCTQQVPNSFSSFGIKNFVGEWFVPHAAFIKIILKEDGSCEFIDYDSLTNHEVCRKGNYKITHDTVILFFQDKKEQFVLYLENDRVRNYYLKNDNFYFVKSDTLKDL